MLEFRRGSKSTLGRTVGWRGRWDRFGLFVARTCHELLLLRPSSLSSPRSESSNSSSATKTSQKDYVFSIFVVFIHIIQYHVHSHHIPNDPAPPNLLLEGKVLQMGSASKLNKAVWKDSGCHQWNKCWSCSSVDVWFRKEWEAKQKWCNEVLKQAFFTRRIP